MWVVIRISAALQHKIRNWLNNKFTILLITFLLEFKLGMWDQHFQYKDTINSKPGDAYTNNWSIDFSLHLTKFFCPALSVSTDRSTNSTWNKNIRQDNSSLTFIPWPLDTY